MTERKKKLEAIFHAVSELRGPDERQLYLREACAGDAPLRRDVEQLLEAAAVGTKCSSHASNCHHELRQR